MASTSFNPTGYAGYDEYDSDNTLVDNPNDNLMIDLGVHASADFWSNVTSDGGDIRITNAAGDTAYSYELENFDTGAQTGILFFNSQGLSTSSDTTYLVYAGNGSASLPAPSDTLGAENVWNSNYELVSHDGGGTDSTSNGNDGTANGGVTPGGATGQLDGATEFDGSSYYFSLDPTLMPSGTSAVTVQSWVSVDNTNENPVIHFGDNTGSPPGSRWTTAIDNGQISLRVNSGRETIGSGLSDGNLHKITLTTSANSDLNDVQFYADGVSLGSGSVTTTLDLETDTAYIGFEEVTSDLFMNGIIDEIRVLSTALSSNYITTEYNNQNDNAAFWTNNGWTEPTNPVVNRRRILNV